VVVGRFNACALTTAGKAHCWGLRIWGALGNGTDENDVQAGLPRAETSPIPVNGDHTFKHLVAGTYHMCGLKESGTLYCWGLYEGENRGFPQPTFVNVPTLITGAPLLAHVIAGSGFTAGITIGGTWVFWGLWTPITDIASPWQIVTPDYSGVLIGGGMFETCIEGLDGRRHCAQGGSPGEIFSSPIP
jgi:alpha-tubulin suppressor-like RCC1 family protein